MKVKVVLVLAFLGLIMIEAPAQAGTFPEIPPPKFPSNNIPTPALLPGLIGLGLGILRKRSADESNSDS
jgi:hypothetical protein